MKKKSIRRPNKESLNLTKPKPLYNPKGAQFPLKFDVREPTPEDLVSASHQVTKIDCGNPEFSKLSTEEIEHIQKRLPDIKTDPQDLQEFKMREKSLKPPVTGDEKLQEFPPKGSFDPPKLSMEDIVQDAELIIQRYLPEGKIRVTFNDAMIKLSSVEAVEAKDVPVLIEPKVEGRFRWIGTKSLLFEPKFRFNQSTVYTCLIKKGTTSQNGLKLKEDVKWTFETPSIKLTNYLPNSTVFESPVFYAHFDQQIEPEKIIKLVKMTNYTGNFELLTVDQVKELVASQKESYRQNIDYYLSSSVEGRFFWFRATKKLQLASTYQLSIGPNVPSAEGPILGDTANFSFHTFGEMKYASHYPDSETVPYRTWTINFTNKIDLEELDPQEVVSIEPKLPGAHFSVSQYSFIISGQSKGSTTYKVNFNTKLRDIYGQQLASEKQIMFKVGPAQQVIKGLTEGMIVLDPTEPEKQTFSLITCNLPQVRCCIFQVEPTQYNRYLTRHGHNRYTIDTIFEFGKKVFDKVLPIESKPDEPVETLVPLKEHFQHPDETLGQIVIVFEPLEKDWKQNYDYHPTPSAWIQSTEISIDHFNDYTDLICWSNSLRTGKTMEGVEFKYSGNKKISDKSGIAHFKLENSKMLIATFKNDICFVPYIADRSYQSVELITHTFNDRMLYKPKETVSIKGFIRLLKRNQKGYTLEGINLKSFADFNYKVIDPRGAEYHKGTITVTEHGSFMISFVVPDNANLGSHTVNFSTKTLSFSNVFQLQEFRTPEFRVRASTSSGPFIGDGVAILTANAEYFSGGGMASANTQWTVTQFPSSYRPVGWNAYNFQKTIPYWFSNSTPTGIDFRGPVPINGMTDSNGLHKICVEFNETARRPKQPVTISASVNVQDLTNQVMGSQTSFLIHPSSLYVGIKSAKNFGKPNEPITISLVVTGINGIVKEDIIIRLKAIHHYSYQKKLQYVTEQKEVLDVMLKSKNQPMDYDLVFKEGGSYSVHAEIQDANGLINETGIVFIVQGGTKIGTQLSKIVADQVVLIADKDSYSPGDTASVFVQSPYDDESEGILHIVTSGIIVEQRFQMDKGSCILTFQITEDMVPGCVLKINLASSNYRIDKFNCPDKEAPKKPAYGSGSLHINVSASHFGLTIDCSPHKKICSPGSDNAVDFVVKDKSGNPMKNSEVTIVVVDEAVLSLTGYSIGNPLTKFYPSHNTGCYTAGTVKSFVFVKDYSTITFEAPPKPRMMMFKSSMGDARGTAEKAKKRAKMERSGSDDEGCEDEEDNSKIEERSNFCPMAVFESATTDSEGKGTIKFTLPDNLTIYRVTAVAVHGTKYYGLGESSIQANLPIMIRPSPPRFLNFGDHAEIAVILQNQSEVALTVNFIIRTTNLTLTNKDVEYLKVKIEPSNRVVVKYPVATEKCGTGRIQIGAEAVGTKFADAVTIEFPIFTPATTEAFATYGEIDKGAICQPILPPPNVYPQFGGLEITTSSTAVQALTDAFLYVYYYQYDCVEQASSRLLSIVALENVLYAFHVPNLPSKTHLKAVMSTGVTKLKNSQRSDGSYGFWTVDSEPNIFLSIHAAHALIRTTQQGYDVPYNTMEKSKSFLVNVEQYLNSYNYSKITQYSLRNFALYVLVLMKYDKETILKRANDLMKEAGFENISMDGLAWILVAIHYSDPKATSNENYKKILKLFQNRVIETPETAGFTTSYGENNDAKLVMLHSDLRTNAIILDALIEVDPKNSLIPKIVKGLMKHKKRGKWGSTSENCFILLSLKKYFDVYENVTPDFVAKMWLGEDFVGDQTFKGRSTDKNLINIPMTFLSEEKNLILQKEGNGRLYYRIGLSYAPKNLQLPALDYGFIVERTYEPVSDKTHVKKNSDGTWTFKEGELVRVRLTMTNTSVRYHVALVDFLPAGLEAMNPDLPIGGTVQQDLEYTKIGKRSGWRWRSTWYEHQNIRDERVEAFSSYLRCGIHKYSYLARATTKGTFVSPPSKAEEMYSPEVFGRSQSEYVIVE